MLIPALLLVAVLALLGWFVRNDRAEYEAFKTLTRTEDRQRAFRRWTAKSFLLFWGAALLVLVLIGRVGTLLRLPPEFAPLLPHLGGFDAGVVPFVIGGVIGGGIIGAVAATLLSRRRAAKPKVLGDIEPLLPRNRDERRWTALLGVNAAIGEELFFRLMLPLLIALATGSAVAAFVAAGLIFGLVHFYQGWVGILATTLVGFFFAALYLASGMLWVAIVLHAVMNLNSLWLRPLLAERQSRSR
ncbi:MAG TPA: CPBP family intramembrane glutamic endopeptidase [Allosphingosinicella sp.]|jgi:membrane protease YdiL (CAAX protease family)|nr:CPBP family intramembrane glutamic endopeptidase [Allosphingosinicella sp.]